MGGGKRTPKSRRSNGDNKNNADTRGNSRSKSRDNRRRRGGFHASSSIRAGLFVEGGVLSDWQRKAPSTSTPPGANTNVSVPKSGSSGRAKGFTAKAVPRSSNLNAFAYQYPFPDLQDGLHLELADRDMNAESKMDVLEPFILSSSKDSQIVIYADEGKSSMSHNTEVVYDYHSHFALGDSSHTGLGFIHGNVTSPNGADSSPGQMEDQEELGSGMLPHEQEMNAGGSFKSEADEMLTEFPKKEAFSKKNSGFISIGGVKLYTEDISDEEDDEDSVADKENSETESSEHGVSTESSESDSSYSGDMSDSGSDIDYDVAEDYLEGIGGSDSLLDAKFLLQASDVSYDSSSGDFDEQLDRMGGLALQDASKEYGMKKKPQSKYIAKGNARDNWVSTVDDFILEKDPRNLSSKKNRGPRAPQTWSLGSQKSQRSRRFPGEKKKHRKELIAAKRRQRMLNRGVDLEEINLKLEQIVIKGVDIHSFQPMHSRDCSQVQRLATIYQLRSSAQGSGKKRFVTVMRTAQTCMPSSTDKIRLEKLVGHSNDDADFSLIDLPNGKSASGGRKQEKKSLKGSRVSLQELQKSGRSKSLMTSADRSSGKKVPLASQPVSFVSSGIMESETNKITPGNLSGENGERPTLVTSESFGAFEIHTKGFGSKMMAKMGFREGQGLGKDGTGMAEPIGVTKRPKSLGLGMNFSESGDESERKTGSESRRAKSKQSGIAESAKRTPQKRIGAFEKHTKGFGSRMMARMGFVEGMGLGKDSQGIVTPLAAMRLPKSRGLGATS